MNIFVYKDTAIKAEQYTQWQTEFSQFCKEYLEKPKYTTVERDFKFYPTVKDKDGDLRAQPEWMRTLVGQVEETGKNAFDHVFIFIHVDRWRSGGDLFRELVGSPKARGIWGQNFSYVYGNQHVHYCRWDEKNMVNTFNTAYHESIGHCSDALIKVELGIEIDGIIESGLRKIHANKPEVISFLNKHGFDWDRDFAHGGRKVGGHPTLDYLGAAGASSNLYVLEMAAPYILQAYKVRADSHNAELKEKVTLLTIIVDLLKLIRSYQNKKDGTPRGT